MTGSVLSGSSALVTAGVTSLSAVGSGCMSVCGGDGWLGTGIYDVAMDVGWSWTLVLLSSSSISPTSKRDPSTQRAKLIYSAKLQQKFPLGIGKRMSSSSPHQKLSMRVT